MSQRWIKICHETRRKPELIEIARRLDMRTVLGRKTVMGLLIDMWIMFDEQTTDGILVGMTLEDLDIETGCPGFGSACVHVGWLEVTCEGLVMPHFAEHTSGSAKSRASDNRRKRKNFRSEPEKLPDHSGQKPGQIREDEIRKEKRTGTAGSSENAEPSRPIFGKSSKANIRTFEHILQMPELQRLSAEHIKPAGTCITGSVFDVQVERDLRASFDASADRRWAIVWYQQQLTAPKPVLTAASAAEAAIVLASVYAASRIRTEGGKVRSRWAIWSRWLRDRDASQVTDEDVRKAAGVVEELLQKRKETVA